MSIPEKLPLVSIIIVNYNGLKYLSKCLESVSKSKYRNREIIIVDNASTDNSIFLAEKFGRIEEITVIRNHTNLGFGEANNIGAKYAKGDYLLFLNNDTEVEPSWIDELINVMSSDIKIGIAQSKLLLLDKKTFDSTGDFVDCYLLSFQRGLNQKDVGQFETIEEVFSARGACMIIKKKVFEQIGMFDPDFFVSLEDIDLSWRARLKGYKIVYVPRSVVYHKSFGTPSSIRAFHGEKNLLTTMLKNYEFGNLLKKSMPNLIINFGAMAFAAVNKNSSLVLRSIKVYMWFLQNLRSVFLKRAIIQSSRKITDHELEKIMLHTNLTLYTSYVLAIHRSQNSPKMVGKITRWYFSLTNHH